MKKLYHSVASLAMVSLVVSGQAMASRQNDLSSGFSPETAHQFVQSENKLAGAGMNNNKRFETVVTAAAKVHDGLSGDVSALRAKMGAESSKAINMLIPESAGKEAVAEATATWNSFFASAVTLVGGGLSDAPVVGYYNPLVDSWVLASFKRDGKTITLTSLIPVSGDSLRATAHTALPESTKYKTPVLETYHASANAFEKVFPPVSSKSQSINVANRQQEYSLVTQRIIKMDGIVAMETKRPEVASAISKFQSAAAKGNALEMRELFTAGKTTTPPEWLASVSAPVRKTLKPAAMFKNGNSMQVAFVSSTASRVVVLVDMKDSNEKAPMFKDIIVSDYAYINGSN